jgi:tetratricopeptide (TPR) repeat protein
VVRVVDGREATGRFVPPEAYAAYAAGALCEARQQWDAAAHAYEAAAEHDRQGAEPLARLGAVRCAAGAKSADEAFGAALRRVTDYAPAYLERGRCALRRGALARAERDVRRAMQLDPTDVDTSLALANVLEAQGKRRQAAGVLDGLAYWHTNLTQVWSEVLALARRSGDAVREGIARERLARLRDRANGATRRGKWRFAALDAALLRGQLGEARLESVKAGASAATVAVRAAALAKWELAREQAILVLRADPGEPDAIAAWFAASARGDAEQLDGTPAPRSGALRPERRPAPMAALVLAEELQRHFGREVAAAFLDSYGTLEVDREDSLAVALLGRFSRRGPAASEP